MRKFMERYGWVTVMCGYYAEKLRAHHVEAITKRP